MLDESPATAGDRALEPFATVEGAMVSARASNPALAEELALVLASAESSAVRAQVGRQVVVTREAWGRVRALANDPLLAVFRQAALGARPMPVHPRMRATWEPARMALAKSLRRDGSVRDVIAYGTANGQITVDEDGDGVGQVTRVPVNVDELAGLAKDTGGTAYTAESAKDLKKVYDQLGSTVGYQKEQKDVAFRFVGLSLVVLLVAAALSLRWFSRLP
jgi:hypothetical protein